MSDSMQIYVSTTFNTTTNFGPLLYPGHVEELISQLNEFGLSGLEVSIKDPRSQDVADQLSLLKTLGVRVKALATGQSFYSDKLSIYNRDSEVRIKVEKRLREVIDAASDFEAYVILGGIRGKLGNDYNSTLVDIGNELISRLCQYAITRGVVLLLEPINRYETDIVNTLDEGIELIEHLGCINLKLLPDTFHMNIEEADIVQSLSRHLPYIPYIHFADSNRLAPGFGHINFTDILSILLQHRYNGSLGLEIIPKPRSSEAIQQGVNYIRSLMRK